MDIKYKAYSLAMDFESAYNYSEHYKIKGNPTVWRYMNLAKFESLLSQKALFFAKPKVFEDPLEGSLSNFDIYENNDVAWYTREEMREVQDFSAISCWHINEYESAGMWGLYLGGDIDGIAIKTNYHTLLKSINDERYKIFSGRVQYIDFHKDMTSPNVFDTLFYKRKSFSHENELRLMIVASRFDAWFHEVKLEMDNVPYEEWDTIFEQIEEDTYNFTNDAGNLVSCDIEQMIENIYVSPKSSEDYVEKVKGMAERYGIPKSKVIQSDLYNDFIY